MKLTTGDVITYGGLVNACILLLFSMYLIYVGAVWYGLYDYTPLPLITSPLYMILGAVFCIFLTVYYGAERKAGAR